MRGLLLLLLALPAPAAALSCLPWDIRAAYWRHADAAETYVLALGRFSALREPFHDRAKDVVIWQATFTGHRASARAFDRPFTAEVTIEDRLFTGIAGGERLPGELARGLPGLTGLVFLRQTPGGYVVTTALCEPVVDTDPTHVRPALDCLNRRSCPRR